MTYQYIASDGITYVIEEIAETHFLVKKMVSDAQNNVTYEPVCPCISLEDAILYLRIMESFLQVDKIKATGLRASTIEKRIFLSITPSLVDYE